MIVTNPQPLAPNSSHHLTGDDSACRSPLTGERWYRRCILCVLVCLRAATESEIKDRCRRFYGIDPLDTSEQLRLLAEVGVIRGVKSDDAEQLWEIDPR